MIFNGRKLTKKLVKVFRDLGSSVKICEGIRWTTDTNIPIEKSYFWIDLTNEQRMPVASVPLNLEMAESLRDALTTWIDAGTY